MTEQQFNEIQERLKVWRQDRNLTQENQRQELINNIKEELEEYANAQNAIDRIDAICDVAVLVFNSYTLKYDIFTGLDKRVEITTSEVPLYVDILKEYIEGFENTEVCAYLTMFVSKLYIKYQGDNFDFYKCMMECIKHIESRQQDPKQKQEWDKLREQGLPLTDKWLKDKNQDESTIYQPDYASCKVES